MKEGITVKTLILLFLALVFFLCKHSDAGVLRLINASTNNVKLDVVSESCDATSLYYCWKCLEGYDSTRAQNVKEILVPVDAFGGNKYFEIVGTDGGLLFNGTCKGLSVFKNYEVSFTDSLLNVKCKAKEI